MRHLYLHLLVGLLHFEILRIGNQGGYELVKRGLVAGPRKVLFGGEDEILPGVDSSAHPRSTKLESQEMFSGAEFFYLSDST